MCPENRAFPREQPLVKRPCQDEMVLSSCQAAKQMLQEHSAPTPGM